VQGTRCGEPRATWIDLARAWELVALVRGRERAAAAAARARVPEGPGSSGGVLLDVDVSVEVRGPIVVPDLRIPKDRRPVRPR